MSPAGNWRLGEEQQDGHDSWQDAGRKIQSSTDVSREAHQSADFPDEDCFFLHRLFNFVSSEG